MKNRSNIRKKGIIYRWFTGRLKKCFSHKFQTFWNSEVDSKHRNLIHSLVRAQIIEWDYCFFMKNVEFLETRIKTFRIFFLRFMEIFSRKLINFLRHIFSLFFKTKRNIYVFGIKNSWAPNKKEKRTKDEILVVMFYTCTYFAYDEFTLGCYIIFYDLKIVMFKYYIVSFTT